MLAFLWTLFVGRSVFNGFNFNSIHSTLITVCTCVRARGHIKNSHCKIGYTKCEGIEIILQKEKRNASNEVERIRN